MISSSASLKKSYGRAQKRSTVGWRDRGHCPSAGNFVESWRKAQDSPRGTTAPRLNCSCATPVARTGKRGLRGSLGDRRGWLSLGCSLSMAKKASGNSLHLASTNCSLDERSRSTERGATPPNFHAAAPVTFEKVSPRTTMPLHCEANRP